MPISVPAFATGAGIATIGAWLWYQDRKNMFRVEQERLMAQAGVQKAPAPVATNTGQNYNVPEPPKYVAPGTTITIGVPTLQPPPNPYAAPTMSTQVMPKNIQFRADRSQAEDRFVVVYNRLSNIQDPTMRRNSAKAVLPELEKAYAALPAGQDKSRSMRALERIRSIAGSSGSSSSDFVGIERDITIKTGVPQNNWTGLRR